MLTMTKRNLRMKKKDMDFRGFHLKKKGGERKLERSKNNADDENVITM